MLPTLLMDSELKMSIYMMDSIMRSKWKSKISMTLFLKKNNTLKISLYSPSNKDLDLKKLFLSLMIKTYNSDFSLEISMVKDSKFLFIISPILNLP